MRGTGCSGGTFDYFEPIEWQDGYDAIEFLATGKRPDGAPLTNGDIAMVGKSYPGITQVFVAPRSRRTYARSCPGRSSPTPTATSATPAASRTSSSSRAGVSARSR